MCRISQYFSFQTDDIEDGHRAPIRDLIRCPSQSSSTGSILTTPSTPNNNNTLTTGKILTEVPLFTLIITD